jgi:hypothetical protein
MSKKYVSGWDSSPGASITKGSIAGISFHSMSAICPICKGNRGTSEHRARAAKCSLKSKLMSLESKNVKG